ncbi:hypothetical protein LIER_00378 [Lithospermum erythrorhizon]|uniref:Uncharacterized protein n=1 Tax=Lithospermum erythrorhizon TaxID=34254 RepID=A0AAV3NKT0_LITER
MGDEIHSRVISRGIPLESPQIASLFSYLKCHGYEVHIVEVDPSQDEINPPSATLSIYHKFEEFNSVRHSPEVLASIQLVSDVVHYASLKPREEGWARMKAKSLEVKLGIIDSKRDERLVCEDLQRACSSLSTTLNGKRFFNDEK